jgi:hypothetical protein
VALYEIRDPKLLSFIQTGGPYATAPQAKDAIARRSVSHRRMMTMSLPYLRRIGHGYVMGASTVVVALAGVGSFLAAVVVGVFIVVGNRDHESRVSERARRFLTWLREEL